MSEFFLGVAVIFVGLTLWGNYDPPECPRTYPNGAYEKLSRNDPKMGRHLWAVWTGDKSQAEIFFFYDFMDEENVRLFLIEIEGMSPEIQVKRL